MTIHIDLSNPENYDWNHNSNNTDFEMAEKRAKDALIKAIEEYQQQTGVSATNSPKEMLEALSTQEFRDIRLTVLNEPSSLDYIDQLASEIVRHFVSS